MDRLEMELVRDATNLCPFLSLDAVHVQDFQHYHNPNLKV